MYVHIIVAQAFLGVLPRGQHSGDLQIDHRDGNKYNNDWRNLEYVTAVENHRRACLSGAHARGERAGGVKLTEAQVIALRQTPGIGREVAALFGIKKSQVYNIRRRLSWKHLP